MSHRPVKNIHFHYLVDPFYFPGRTRIKRLLLALFKKEGYQVQHINYIFCTDAYLLKINRNHLNHDTYTDIITFPYSSGKEPILSDIYISVERIRENSAELGLAFYHELCRVIIHGALHLSGYKDKSKDDIKKIRATEDYYLKNVVSRGTK